MSDMMKTAGKGYVENASPEIGIGALPPLSKFEHYYNKIVAFLPNIAALLLFSIVILITLDIIGRTFFNMPINGITDLEGLSMSIVGFIGMAYAVSTRQAIAIDLLYSQFADKNKRLCNLLSNLLCCVTALLVGYAAFEAAIEWRKTSPILDIPQQPFVFITALCLLGAALGYIFQIIQSLRDMLKRQEYLSILLVVAASALLICLPFIYKLSGIKLSGLGVGAIGFAILLGLMLLRIPLGYVMCLIGVLGLMALSRKAGAALLSVGPVPFERTSEFIVVAFPMFMLMGEMTFKSGLSTDLFYVFNRWLGRMPGGLACASVAGCAGFGAVCGDSLATVITMTSVALPPMQENKYNPILSTGALAAGGTLGILIPPSVGFIIYSTITEESVGSLFVAGIIPGILLTLIFIGIIVIQVKIHPDWAPRGQGYPLKDKLASLVYLIPVAVLFGVVVGGILGGFFTPAEGGAAGTFIAFVYACFRRKMNGKILIETLYGAGAMFGKFFSLFVGLYIFGAFLTASRLPYLLSDFISALEVNRYIILCAIILLYVVLGCIMNIVPMMMITLPSIYPTVQALGFDGIWFGVITVIVMEMGMITPPVGMNVFTLSSMVPDIPSSQIFRGVMPFFLGMILCVALVVIFPQIALFLV